MPKIECWDNLPEGVRQHLIDRIARSTKNFLEIVDELNSVNIEFVSAREAIDTSGPMGRMFLTMVARLPN